MVYLETKARQELESHEKIDYYLAQIAFEVYRHGMTQEQAAKISLEQFLIKLKKSKQQEEEPKQLTEEEKQRRTNIAKAIWRVRLHGGKKPRKPGAKPPSPPKPKEPPKTRKK